MSSEHLFVFADSDFRQLCISVNDEAGSKHFFAFADSDFRQLCISDNDEAVSDHFFVFAISILDAAICEYTDVI